MSQREGDVDRGQKYLHQGPQRGDIFRHYKGGLYVILGRSLKEDDLTDMVHYQNIADGSLWCRPLREWHDQIKTELSVGVLQTDRFVTTGNHLDI